MAKTKVTIRFQVLDFLDRFMNNTTLNAIGKTVTEEALEMISEGSSPARGEGRFERYKDRKKYPGDLKPARPVNLHLTGSMLSGYGFKIKDRNTVEVGMVRGSSRDKEIAGYHQDGTEHMAARPIVPREGEEWAVSIMRSIRDLYGKRLSDYIRETNKSKSGK